MTRSAKHWCFTLNNYSNDEKQHLAELYELPVAQRPVYLVYGEEVGENGTPHLQGFISFNARKTLRQVKDVVSTRAHCEQARGSPSQAAEYCKKDGAYSEFGVCPSGSGKRNDIVKLYDAIKSGKTAQEIADEFPSQYLRYRSNILATIRDLQPERNWMPENIILWGKSGTGKTRTVFDNHERKDIYVHTGEQWFDGYAGQPVVLFDDFTGSEFKLGYLLKLLDRYPMRVPVKGGYVQWVPKTIYFTSNKNPDDWYGLAMLEHRLALKRRIKETKYFDYVGVNL